MFYNEITKPPSNGLQRFIVSYSADIPFSSAPVRNPCIRGMFLFGITKSWVLFFYYSTLTRRHDWDSRDFYTQGLFLVLVLFLFGSIVIYSIVEDVVVLKCEGERDKCKIIR